MKLTDKVEHPPCQGHGCPDCQDRGWYEVPVEVDEREQAETGQMGLFL